MWVLFLVFQHGIPGVWDNKPTKFSNRDRGIGGLLGIGSAGNSILGKQKCIFRLLSMCLLIWNSQKPSYFDKKEKYVPQY